MLLCITACSTVNPGVSVETKPQETTTPVETTVPVTTENVKETVIYNAVQGFNGVVVNARNTQIEVLPFNEKNPTPFEFTVSLEAGDVVSIWVADEYSWVSAYLMLDVIAE